MLSPPTCVGLRYGPGAFDGARAFLGSLITCALRSPGGSRYFRGSARPTSPRRVYLPPFNRAFRRTAAVSLLRSPRPSGAGVMEY